MIRVKYPKIFILGDNVQLGHSGIYIFIKQSVSLRFLKGMCEFEEIAY